MKSRTQSCCFLFLKDWNDTGCLCLAFDSTGMMTHPLEHRSIHAIRDMQDRPMKTYAILPDQFVSLHRVTLPWLGENKARETLPFALEDSVTEPIQQLHFAVDKQYYQHGQYLVVVCRKSVIEHWRGLFEQADLQVDVLTLAWFALKPSEIWALDDQFLMNLELFKGRLDLDLGRRFLSQCTASYHGRAFYDHPDLPQDFEHVSHDVAYHIAQTLLEHPCINLYQGEFRVMSSDLPVGWYYAALSLLCLWLLTFLITHEITLHRLHQENDRMETEIARIYHTFFPAATEVIQPRFRIEQRLNAQKMGEQPMLWSLLNALVEAHAETPVVTIDAWRYEGHVLIIQMKSPNFEVLSTFSEVLKSKVKKLFQRSAVKHEQDVRAVLEISV